MRDVYVPSMGDNADIFPSTDAEELIDFTCVSPWERLALDIELELRSWGIHDGKISNLAELSTVSTSTSIASAATSLAPTPVVSSRVSLGDTVLCLELRTAPSNNWLHSFPLERIFGIHQYVLLTSATSNGIGADDTSEASVLLSALCVAANSCQCALPLIVPVGRPSSLRFVGRQVYPSHHRFSCDFTHPPADGYTHLAGILSLFRNKRISARAHSVPSLHDASVEAHFSYDWTDFSFKLAPAPGTFASDRRLAALQMDALLAADPVKQIRISAVWGSFATKDLQHNQTLAAMPAATATRLRISLSSDLTSSISKLSFPSARIPLTSCARANLRLAQLAGTLRNASDPCAPVAVVNIHNIVQACRSSDVSGRERMVTMLEEYLVQVGDFVSAEAIQDDSIDEEFLTSAIAAIFDTNLSNGIMVDVVDAIGPNGADMTILERLARLMAVSESPAAASRLWNLFLDGIQLHWEMQIAVSGVPFDLNSGPDHAASLLVQKLQMINCCVERLRNQRETAKSMEAECNNSDSRRGRKNIIDGLEFIGAEMGKAMDTANTSTTRHVWAPLVQPHLLFTRDMVEEELQRIVARAEGLGGNGRGDELEAKRQSLTLRSDMMAFKAANPGAGLADFVRWFSPSDWVGDIDENMGALEAADHSAIAHGGPNRTRHPIGGRLSARMSRQGNIWEKLWESAEPVPAHHQVPLFDAAGHGSKALTDLRASPLTQVLVHLSIIQCGSACEILQGAFIRPPKLPRVLKVIEKTNQDVRNTCSKLGLNSVDTVALEITAATAERVAVAEHAALIASSVLSKLPPADGMGGIVDALANGDFMDVVADKERQLIARMAGLDDDGWRNVLLPEVREFVITSSCGDRMYTRLDSSEFRVGFRLSLSY